LFLGWFGVHKFYEGKILFGILYLLTFGLFGVGVVIDLILIILKPNPYYV
jgi:TM2 domain-containing membrane protein YozV